MLGFGSLDVGSSEGDFEALGIGIKTLVGERKRRKEVKGLGKEELTKQIICILIVE